MTRLNLIAAVAALSALPLAFASAPASAAAMGPMPALKPIIKADGSTAAQPVWWRRDCWWAYGHRHCRLVWHHNRWHRDRR